MDLDLLIKKILRCAYTVRGQLSYGYLESVYQKALQYELEAQGIHFETEYPVTVMYKGRIVGIFRVDILVERRIILELKAVEHIVIGHEVQLVNYLVATGIDHGLLINFGPEGIKARRKFRLPKLQLV
jgi:GxxExxY protein